jgi:hypothetical protein
MTASKLFKFVLASSLLTLMPTLVQAASSSDYEEVSYDDLVQELSTKSKVATEAPSVGVPKLSAGIGYANTFTNIAANNKSYNRYANGIQLSLGSELFSPEYYTEGIFKNYGSPNSGEDFSIRELDLNLGYKNTLQGIWKYTVSTGISNRFLKFEDPDNSVNVDDTTPAFMVSTGFMAQVHKRLSFGGEVSLRQSMISKTADKNSVDFAFRITTSL